MHGDGFINCVRSVMLLHEICDLLIAYPKFSGRSARVMKFIVRIFYVIALKTAFRQFSSN